MLPTVRSPKSLFRLPWLALALTLSASAIGAAEANSPTARRDEVQHRLEEKKALIERAKAKERALGAEIAVESARIDAVEDKIAGLAAQLGELQSRLAASRQELAALDAQLAEQAARLRAEGVVVDDTLTLDLARYRWWPDAATLAAWRLAPEVVRAIEALIARATGLQLGRGGMVGCPESVRL